MMLPVHCCCDPAKRLGWVNVLDVERPWPVRFVVQSHPIAVFRPDLSLAPSPSALIVTTIDQINLEPYPAVMLDCGHWTISLRLRRLAVKSADRPLSDWVRVPSFRLTLD